MSFAAVENPRTGEYGVLRMAAAGGWPRLADGRGWRMAAAGGWPRPAGRCGWQVGAAGGWARLVGGRAGGRPVSARCPPVRWELAIRGWCR